MHVVTKKRQSIAMTCLMPDRQAGQGPPAVVSLPAYCLRVLHSNSKHKQEASTRNRKRENQAE